MNVDRFEKTSFPEQQSGELKDYFSKCVPFHGLNFVLIKCRLSPRLLRVLGDSRVKWANASAKTSTSLCG